MQMFEIQIGSFRFVSLNTNDQGFEIGGNLPVVHQFSSPLYLLPLTGPSVYIGQKKINPTARFHLCYVSSHWVSYVNILMYLAAVQESTPDSNIGLDGHLFQQSHRRIKAACSTQKIDALQSVLCRKDLPSRQNVSEPPQDRYGYILHTWLTRQLQEVYNMHRGDLDRLYVIKFHIPQRLYRLSSPIVINKPGNQTSPSNHFPLRNTIKHLGCICCTGLSRTGLASGTKLDWLRID